MHSFLSGNLRYGGIDGIVKSAQSCVSEVKPLRIKAVVENTYHAACSGGTWITEESIMSVKFFSRRRNLSLCKGLKGKSVSNLGIFSFSVPNMDTFFFFHLM